MLARNKDAHILYSVTSKDKSIKLIRYDKNKVEVKVESIFNISQCDYTNFNDYLNQVKSKVVEEISDVETEKALADFKMKSVSFYDDENLFFVSDIFHTEYNSHFYICTYSKVVIPKNKMKKLTLAAANSYGMFGNRIAYEDYMLGVDIETLYRCYASTRKL